MTKGTIQIEFTGLKVLTDAIPSELYVGKREAVRAEVGTHDFYEGKYLAQPIGEADFLVVNYLPGRDQAREWARELNKQARAGARFVTTPTEEYAL